MTLANLHTRHREPELMDQPGLEPHLHAHALNGLKRLNRFSRSSAILWRPIDALARQRRKQSGDQAAKQSGKPLRVLDIASGGGDVVLSLAWQAARRGLSFEFQGCDISPFSVRYANEQAESIGAANVSFTLLNAINEPLPAGFDVIMCSLFLHHLSQADALTLLSKMAEATQDMVLVNDLRRTRLGYALAQLACRFLTRSPIVHVDGPISVAAAFTGDEARALATEAGLDAVNLTHHFPQRFLLSWRRSS